MLICQDVQASIAFYVDVLEFEVLDRLDDVGVSGWASLRRGGARLMLASPPERTPGRITPRGAQCIHYFYVDDVAALRAAVIRAGWPAGDLVARFYGMKELEIADPDGHVLLFGQDADAPPAPE